MTLTLRLLRPDDLLALRVELVNLKVNASAADGPWLVRENAHDSAYLIYYFPPQSIAEQAFFETAAIPQPGFNPPPSTPPLPPPAPLPGTGDAIAAPGSLKAQVAGESRLVFSVPAAVTRLPYSLAGLLDWSRLEPVLPPAAQVLPGGSSGPDGTPTIAAPGPRQTALELPYRLLLAPNVMSGNRHPVWRHALEPVQHAGRAELWHTRLAIGSGSREPTEASAAAPVPVRVVWSPDADPGAALPSDDEIFRTAMTARDRSQVVILSAGFDGYTLSDPNGARPYVPTPIEAERLYLSALGGWLTSRGAWPYPVSYPITAESTAGTPGAEVADSVQTLDLIEWDHVATQGRDHYVRIVYEGYLYPFGHRASLVKVSERKVLAPEGTAGNPAGSPVAYLRQRMYIVVRETEKTYPPADYEHAGREMPLMAGVRLTTRVTPAIDAPPDGATSFWVEVGGEPFAFHAAGTDLSGQAVDFLAPLIFVSLSENDLDSVVSDYVSNAGRRRCAARGQRMTYADPDAGDTTLKTGALYFTTQPTGENAPWVVAPFVPVLDSAEVTVPSVSELLGRPVAVLVSFYPAYLAQGLDPNAGVFAQLAENPLPLTFSADSAGGFAQPNISLTALSARKGLVAGSASQAAAGTIDPSDYFGASEARLFGVIPLSDLIPVDALTKLATAAQNAPEIRTKALPNSKHPTRLQTVLTWKPDLQAVDGRTLSTPVPVKLLVDDDGDKSSLELKVEITRTLDGKPPTSSATGTLTNFRLELFDIVDLRIASITFSSKNGAKSTVKLELASSQPITFDGPLSFVQTLANILPPGLFGGRGPSVKAAKTQLEVSYTLALPPLTCGVFSLQHIAITAGLDLPYIDGKPAVEFGFASRKKPFLLTVEIFGGGGFIHLIVGAGGVQMVEGALEFGGNYAFDVGVASGGVHAMAGIYFQLKGSSSDLTGFIDIGGEVSVLGIVSISLDVNLSLSWQHSSTGNVIQGRATLTVSVHVLFFSASVELSVERSFSAGGSDPDVGQLMSAEQWSDYARAFG